MRHTMTQKTKGIKKGVRKKDASNDTKGTRGDKKTLRDRVRMLKQIIKSTNVLNDLKISWAQLFLRANISVSPDIETF